jgi:hypothetical protein
MGTAPMPSLCADDARPPFRCATLFLLRVYLTLEWEGSQLPLARAGPGLCGSSQVRGEIGGAMAAVCAVIPHLAYTNGEPAVMPRQP